MPQFRLTQKFAKDCKINVLPEPSIALHPLDDWFIDVIRANRKKVAIVTHAKSTFTLFLPYLECGGAAGVINFISVTLKNMLSRLKLDRYIESVDVLFGQPILICKTVDKKILGHMTDFKYISGAHISHALEKGNNIDWNEIADHINNMPVNFGTHKYIFPKELFIEILNQHYLN